MAFPGTASDLEVCIAYGANVSSDLTTLSYSGNLSTTLVQPRLVITRGRIGGAARTQPTSIDMALKNPGGVFSPRNISGPHYGQLRRNTPVWVRLDPGTGMVTRAIGYIPDWPTRWTGPDINDHIPTQASGALRRLGSGEDPQSALRRSISLTSPVAYWPLEDGPNSTLAASGLLGGSPMVVTAGKVSFASTPGPAGSMDLADFASGGFGGTLTGQVPSGASSTSWRVEFDTKFNTFTPGAFAVALQWFTGGGVTLWEIDAAELANGGLSLQYITAAGAFGGPFDSGVRVDDGLWHHVRVDASQSGGNIALTVTLDGVVVITQTVVGLAMGSVGTAIINPTGDPTEEVPSLGHLAVWAPWSSSVDVFAASQGYPGETASARVTRLCAAESIVVDVTAGSSEPMGPQLPATTVDLLRECEDSDEAVIVERRTGQIGFDPRSTRYNRTVTMTVPYLSVADMAPDDDDRDLRNYVTVTRIGGSSATVQRTTGPLGTTPATGVDRYPDGISRSLSTDAQARQHAGWLLNLGTVDEPRYTIGLNLVAHRELITQWLACDIGSRIQITNPPAIQVGPAPLDLIIEGYQELLDGVEWYVIIHALPYRPYEVLQVQTGTGNRSRIAAGTSTLDLGYAATATSLSVTSVATRWIDSATFPSKFPILIEISGEVMTCTAIAGTGLTQTFTVTRGLHGVTKALPISSPVQIWRAPVIAL